MIFPGRSETLFARQVQRQQRGVALALVIWFIAGMSLLVSGIVSIARVDTQMAQLHVARAKAVAAGDGAIHLLMADILSGKLNIKASRGILTKRYRVGELDVEVSLVPASGLVNLNSASAKILSALFVVTANLGEGEAKIAADNVVKWRFEKPGTGRRQFAAIEDLLRVDGVSRTMLDGVRDYVMVGRASGRNTNWSSAPESILAIMKKADPQKAENIIKRRGENLGGAGANPGAPGNSEGKGAAINGPYRVDAIVRYGDKSWLRRRWVSRSGTRSESQLPWRITRTEAPRVIGTGGGPR